MKVIKKGRQQSGWSNEFKCTGSGNGGGGCGAVLLVETPDLFTTHHHDHGGGHDVFVTFECSECGVLTDIKHSGVSHRDLPSRSDWKKMQGPLRVELTKEDITKILSGDTVNRQVVSGRFNNAPMFDLEIVAEGQPPRS
jgi:hypothetical protein